MDSRSVVTLKVDNENIVSSYIQKRPLLTDSPDPALSGVKCEITR